MNSHPLSETVVVSSPPEVHDCVEEHRAFREGLQKIGFKVIEIPLVPGLSDSVFVKDHGILFEHEGQRRAFIASPAVDGRKGETRPRAQAFDELGFKEQVNSTFAFEGGDLEILPSFSEAFMGYGIRSDRRAADQVSDFLGTPVTALELSGPGFFHLDLAMGILDDGTVFAAEEAFTPDSWKRLKKSSNIRTLVQVSERTAYRCGLNWMTFGDRVLLGRPIPEIVQLLEARGMEVLVTPLESFHRWSGSVACLSNEILRH